MTQGVNLLPGHYGERLEERRRISVTAGALLVLLLVLGLLSFTQGRRLDEARSARDAEQARTAVLSARRADLAPFGQLADGVDQRERILTAVMGTEVSWARVLAGLSAAFPADASLVSFTAESTLLPAGSEGTVPTGDDEASPIGSTTYNGYSVAGFDPGVAETLRRLDTVPGLSEPTLQVGAEGEIGGMPVTTFDGSTLLDTAALSGRYVEDSQ